jgi:hypothetical protein
MKRKEIPIIIVMILLFSCEEQDLSVVESLSFNMSPEQISKYYEKVDSLIDKEDTTEIIPEEEAKKLTEEDLREIQQKRLYSNEFFPNDLYIKRRKDYGIGYFRTRVFSDGYINFKNYEYRGSFGGQAKSMSVNPLRACPGYMILAKDARVYNKDDIEIGLLRKGSVLKIHGVGLGNTIGVDSYCFSQHYIKIEDIDVLSRYVNTAAYKIIGEKVYRYIDGLRIEIETPIYRLKNGLRSIRNDLSAESPAGFYFWEYDCDYFFDEDGIFIEYGFGPGYGH